MLKRPFDPMPAAARAVAAAREAVGDRLVGATLYGSAAGDAFDPAHSDVNVAFVFSALTPAELDALRVAHREWRKARITRPLLLTRDGLARSLDVFPLEYLLIRERHRPLFGEDCFAGLAIDRGALRHAVERVLRAQDLALNWTYLALAETPSGARHWAARSGTAIAASASGLLYLAGDPIPPSRPEIASRCAARFGIMAEEMMLLLDRRSEGRAPVEVKRLLESAQGILTRLTDAVDALDSEPNPTSRRS